MKTFQLDILSPDKEIFSGQVESVQAPGTDGLFQVLVNHAPMISSLANGRLKVKSEAGEQIFHAEGGVIEVLKNKVIVLVERVVEPVG